MAVLGHFLSIGMASTCKMNGDAAVMRIVQRQRVRVSSSLPSMGQQLAPVQKISSCLNKSILNRFFRASGSYATASLCNGLVCLRRVGSFQAYWALSCLRSRSGVGHGSVGARSRGPFWARALGARNCLTRRCCDSGTPRGTEWKPQSYAPDESVDCQGPGV